MSVSEQPATGRAAFAALGATRDAATTTANGSVLRECLDGVAVHRVQNIITGNGITTEVYSAPWGFAEAEIRHVIQVTLNPHAVSAWHAHERQTDHIYPLDGTLEVVLYDDRAGSPTRGGINVFRLNRHRPEIVRIPPGIWHGTRNLEPRPVSFINYFDMPYRHDDPDEWRLPWDTDRIPYRFA